MAKSFKIPFAFTGDKTTVPVALQPDGSVSYTQGFGPDYELDKLVDPINAKDVPRDQTNQLFHDVTEAVGEVQQYGAALWSADMAPYPINARAYHTGKLWRSNVANNNGEPGVAGWDDVSANLDYINAPIAAVAAAGTIDLTAGAPNTSQIAISGTGVSINGFTVAANRFFVVKMTGASNTLVNSASLVTGRGANIPVAAGDCFLMRSTAANMVEIVGGTFLLDRGIGSGQTWQDVSASRSFGVNYTNTTGRSIMIMITQAVSTTSPGSRVGLSINMSGRAGSLNQGISYNGSASNNSASLTLYDLVLPGQSYNVSDDGSASGRSTTWRELTV